MTHGICYPNNSANWRKLQRSACILFEGEPATRFLSNALLDWLFTANKYGQTQWWLTSNILTGQQFELSACALIQITKF